MTYRLMAILITSTAFKVMHLMNIIAVDLE